ncbi:hypothetical protein SETIT_2G045900v2 [Setaria italica]|uniref:Uncharacterized protein n=1 Tax=Setaria italica TaxID=4555 RepID=A0A368PV39_SETIT|nr:hypothetical protein SETIT_2G045900v2 [Setaria italica]
MSASASAAPAARATQATGLSKPARSDPSRGDAILRFKITPARTVNEIPSPRTVNEIPSAPWVGRGRRRTLPRHDGGAFSSAPRTALPLRPPDQLSGAGEDVKRCHSKRILVLLSSTGEPAGGAVNANCSFPFPQPAGDAALDGIDLAARKTTMSWPGGCSAKQAVPRGRLGRDADGDVRCGARNRTRPWRRRSRRGALRPHPLPAVRRRPAVRVGAVRLVEQVSQERSRGGVPERGSLIW